jgi:hypothetical protein
LPEAEGAATLDDGAAADEEEEGMAGCPHCGVGAAADADDVEEFRFMLFMSSILRRSAGAVELCV